MDKPGNSQKHPFDIGLRFALKGIHYAFQNERNFRLHVYIATGAVLASVALRLPLPEIAIVCVVIGIVLIAEMFNTVIEKAIDLVSPNYHELAEIAKDVAAGAVLIAALLAIIIAILILFPHLLSIIHSTYAL